ncbi:MAG: prolyl oligopeptidase family serine peptidase [Acidobacteriota bacterium]
MRHALIRSFVFVTILLIAVVAALAAPQFTVHELLKLKRVSDPQPSPDGKTVAFVVTVIDEAANTRNSDVWLVSTEGGNSRQLTHGKGSDDTPRWSPYGKSLAFVSDREGSSQIWTVSPSGGEAKKLTAFPTGAAGIVWSPDGKNLAFTSDIYSDCDDAPCIEKREKAKSESKIRARVIDGLLFRHWNTWKDGLRSHIWIVPASGGTARDVTPGDFDAPPFSLGGPPAYAFSPDSSELAFERNTDKVEATSTNSDLFVVSVAGGQPRRVTSNTAADGGPLYSPDGRYIAYRAQRRAGFESDRWQLMLYDRQSQQHRSLTASLDRAIDGYAWARDSRSLFVVYEDQGKTTTAQVLVAEGSSRRLLGGATDGDLSVTSDGRTLIFTRQSLTHPVEIYRASSDGTAVAAITHINDAFLEPFHLRAGEEISWQGAGAARIHGWIVKPPDFDPARKYPLLFLIHGGPQGVWGDAFTFRWNAQVFASRGYVIAMANPRGSTGFGQKFVDEISGDWGGKVYEDLMNGVDMLEKLPYVDADRIGAAGGSYGGYMVNWILGHTNRFKALVSHAGVFNLTSMYGVTEELWFTEWEFEGTPWTNPKMYDRWSPHNHVRTFKTPTLVIHGELDFRVPVAEGFQLFTALQRMGVPSRLLYFPDEGHWVNKPQNSVLWYTTFLDWMDKYLKK